MWGQCDAEDAAGVSASCIILGVADTLRLIAGTCEKGCTPCVCFELSGVAAALMPRCMTNGLPCTLLEGVGVFLGMGSSCSMGLVDVGDVREPS